MKADLVLKGGTVVTGDSQFRADVVIKDGKLIGLSTGVTPSAVDAVDVSGKFVLPGIIDSHVHVRYPGNPQREDFATGTRAAAAGGVTTILEHPISEPAVSTREILLQRERVCSPQAYVDYGFFGAAGEENIDDIAGLAEAGVVAFKTFLHAAPPGRESEFEGLTATTEGALYEVMRAVADTGKLETIHAESNAMVQYYIDKYSAEGRNDILAHIDSRPVLSEIVSCASSLELADNAGCRLAVAHISGGTVAEFLAEAKAEGRDVLVETCPHYLFLTREDTPELGPYAKINPPIRPQEEQDLLWDALQRGIIDYVGSDHGPFLKEEKESGWDDIWGAPAGAVGLETLLPLFLDAVNDGRLDLSTVVRLLSENTAREFGLWPNKGSLQLGTDADLTVVDMQMEQTVNRDEMYTKARECALLYDGWDLRGWPCMTVVRGTPVMVEGDIVGEEGYGKWIKS
jgi:allantoinase